jgi:hypothetical protein
MPHQWPIAEGFDDVVQALTGPRDGTLIDPSQPEGHQQVIHFPGADPFDVGLLHHGQQRLLRPPARF